MQLIQQSARLIVPENGLEALRRIEQAGRNCYRSEDRITADSAPKFVEG